MKKIKMILLGILCLAFFIPTITKAEETILNTDDISDYWTSQEITGMNYYDLENNDVPIDTYSVSIQKHRSVAWFDTHGQSNIGEQFHNISLMTINGQPVYCIEPYVAIQWNGNSVDNYDGTLDFSFLNPITKIRIWELGKFGYGYAGNSDKFLVATQIMIWEALGIYIQPLELDMHTSMDISAERAAIEEAIRTFYILPSFNDTDVDFNYLESFQLEDKNSVLNNFEFSSPKGFELTQISNSILELRNTSLYYDKNISFQNKNAGRLEANVIYGKPGSQSVFMATSGDPVKTVNLRLKMITGDLTLSKFDEFNGIGLPGQEFGIWLSKTSIDEETGGINPTWYKGEQLFKEDGSNWFTDENGQIVIKEILPPGFYIMEELSTTNEYETSDKQLRFEVKANELTEVEFYNDFRSVSINLKKYDEEEKWRPINGAEFIVRDITDEGQVNPIHTTELRLNKNIDVDLDKFFNITSLLEYFSSDSSVVSINQNVLTSIDNGYSTLSFKKDGKHVGQIDVVVGDFANDVEQVKVEVDTDMPMINQGPIIFRGLTGSNYIQIVDKDNHNYPISNKDVEIYEDAELLNLLDTLTSDEYGIIYTDKYPVGDYYYKLKDAPISIGNTFSVLEKNDIAGQLNINNLKWGRKYSICETKLPEGYDFIDDEDKANGYSCQEYTMDLKEDIDVVNTSVSNMKRRLAFKLFKQNTNKTTLLNGAVFKVWDITEEGKNLGVLIDPEYTTPMIKTREYLGEYITGALFIKDTSLKMIDESLGDIPSNYQEVPNVGVLYRVSKSKDFSIFEEYYTNNSGEIIKYLEDGKYYVQKDGTDIIDEYFISKGTIYLPDLKYGNEYLICETKAPSGYYINGDGCEVVVPKADYGIDIFENYRINEMIIIPIMGD